MAAHESLESAIHALRNGDRETARALLQEYTTSEPLLADGWLWRAAASETAADKLAYLRQALALNPQDRRVIAGLRALGEIVGGPLAPSIAASAAAHASTPPAPAVAASAAASVPTATLVSPLALPRFVATDVRAARVIPWRLIALASAVVLLIPLTFWLI